MIMDKEFSRAEIDALFEESLRLSDIGEYEKAEDGLRKVYEYRKEEMGEDDHATLEAMHGLAFLCNLLKRHEEALSLYEKLYSLRKMKLGQTHRDSLMTLHNIAFTYEMLGEYRKSADLFQNVLNECERLFGFYDKDTMAAAYCLIYVSEKMKDGYAEIELREKILAAKLSYPGEYTLDTLDDIFELAEACNKYRYTVKARTYAQECFIIHVKELGLKHKRTTRALEMLSLAYIRLDEYKRSCSLDKLLYRIQCEELGELDEKSMRTLESLAYTYLNYGENEKAKAAYLKLRGDLERVGDPEQSDWIESVDHYLARLDGKKETLGDLT